jgi:putative intracellular protease/amidase
MVLINRETMRSQTMSPQTVHVALYDGLSDWEIAYATARIDSPLWHKEPGRYTIATVAVTADPVRTMGGMRIVPDLTLSELSPQESAMLILAGSGSETDWDSGGNTEMAEAAREFLEAGVPVAAICGATFGLARAGLLDHRAHTSAAPEYLQMSGYRGGEHYQNKRAVTDGDLITAGPADVLDFTRHILARLDIFRADVLEAWYQLFNTGDAKWYGAINAAVAQ